jgi:hypothetical protein
VQLAYASPSGGRRAAAYEDDDPEEFRLEYFKPGFVADSHAFRKVLRSAGTPPAAGRLLVSVADHTTGYGEEWSAIRRQRLMEHADIKSRTTFQDAKSWLLKGGHIQVKWDPSKGCMVYALGESLRVLLRPEERLAKRGARTGRRRALKAVPDQVGVRPAGHHVSSQSDPMIKKQENEDQHHRTPAPPVPEPFGDDELLEVVIEREQEWNGPDETPDPEEPTCAPGDTAQPAHQEQPQQPARSAELGRLIAQLIEQGVHERVAVRLAKTQTPEVIASAIKRLPKVATTNPAGYLVAEISRGGYKEPDRTRPIRVIQDEIHRQRQAERERDAEVREQSSAKVAQTVDRFALLPPDHQAEIRDRLRRQAEAEGFTRLPGWSQDHPVYRGLLAEMVAEWIPSALSGVVLAPG